jgi:hypothetical protein
MAVENLHTLVGTLYAKDCRIVKNTKKPNEPDWLFYSIKVECKVNVLGKNKTTIPELQLDMGVNYDGFKVGDQVEVDYYLAGKAINSNWYKTEAKAVYIKFSDETTPPKRTDNKVLTGAMSNVDELENTDKVFIPPAAKRPTDNAPVDDEFGDLPF